MNNQQYLTVSALTKYIKRKFDVDPYLATVFVRGEISNFKKHTSGHLYFSLKDEKARIQAVMFHREAKQMRFLPEDGMNVLVQGHVSVYEQSGQYQIYVQEMVPDGIGELFLAFEQLKLQLEKEGLFHPERKKPIPKYPKTIGVVTSPTGAAIRDIITTIHRRYPIGQIYIYPALVQGQLAAESIAKAIQKANDHGICDVLIVGRGGGSIEELWAFNEEPVARAIAQSNIPIISAVGHETDVTIADFVADLRAPTPTGAAELAVPHMEEIMERLLHRQIQLFRLMAEKIRFEKTRLYSLEQSYILRNPHRIYEPKWERIDRIVDRMERAYEKIIFRKTHKLQQLHQVLKSHHPAKMVEQKSEKYIYLKERLTQQSTSIMKLKVNHFLHLVQRLESLSPLNILKRGYSVAYREDGKLVKSIQQVEQNEKIVLQVMDGKFHCTVDHIEKGESNGTKNEGSTNI